MNKLVLSLVSIAFLAFAFTDANDTATYKVDNVNSTIAWMGYKVTGSHAGTINVKGGELNFKKGKLKGGKFEIDMTSITVTDLEGKMKGKLEGHLKNDDFFGVDKFPVATFETTSVKAAADANTYNVVGNLTIKNITQEITFVANVDDTKTPIETTASIKVDRSKFDVRYGSKSFFDNLGDKAIYDEFDLEVKLVTK